MSDRQTGRRFIHYVLNSFPQEVPVPVTLEKDLELVYLLLVETITQRKQPLVGLDSVVGDVRITVMNDPQFYTVHTAATVTIITQFVTIKIKNYSLALLLETKYDAHDIVTSLLAGEETLLLISDGDSKKLRMLKQFITVELQTNKPTTTDRIITMFDC